MIKVEYNKEKEILLEYKELHPLLNKWGKTVDSILKNEILQDIKNSGCVQIITNYRLKDNESYVSKAIYRKKYSNPLLQMEDKIGTRIVLLKTNDILIVKDLITKNNNWKAKITKNIDKEIENEPLKFDYQSLHIVVNPLPNNKEYNNSDVNIYSCEIQIRTLLQHAFAEISHDSTYKGPYKDDIGIKRKLSKSMALMEATDDYFCSIYDDMNNKERDINIYLNSLTNMFKEFYPEFNQNNVNKFLTDKVFDLLKKKDITIENLKLFVSNNKDDLQNYINQDNILLFKQPVFLLIFYYYKNNNSFLHNHWDFEEYVLKTIYQKDNSSYPD